MAIGANLPHGLPNATLVRDGWRAQMATRAKYHQTCLPHLLGHLNYLNEKYGGNQWGKNFRALLYDAIDLSKDPIIGQRNIERTKIVQRLGKLMERPPDKEHGELHTFYGRMCRERRHLFSFLFIRDVPSDNNASERAIRNVKVKQKISGQSKTASNTELCQNTIRHRHHNQKWNECLGCIGSYR